MLENQDYHLDFKAEKGCFSLYFSKLEGWAVHDAGLGFLFERDYHKYFVGSNQWMPSSEKKTVLDTRSGRVQQYEIEYETLSHDIRVTLIFQLCDAFPIICWKMVVSNFGAQPVKLHRLDMFSVAENQQGKLALGNVPEADDDLAFYSNGWQSWAVSAAYGASDSAWRTRLPMIQTPLVVNPGTPQPRRPGSFSSDFFGVIGGRGSRRAILLGFESQEKHFGTVEVDVKRPIKARLWANGDASRLDPGCVVETDNAVIGAFSLDWDDPLGPYLDTVAKYHDVSVNEKTPVGWCSWYQFYDKVTADQIDQNLDTLIRLKPRLPLELVQIDDGFQSEVGDWLEFKPTFPEGVAGLAQKIGQAGYTPGLWLAPFIVHPGADLARRHPELIMRNQWGLPVNAGFVWDVFTQALDLTHPGALEYCYRVVETAVKQWGFPYLKLDFLYAGALQGKRYDPSMTRAQILREGLTVLREAAGEDAFLLGCGMPLGSGIGLVDAMRIGADVSGDWTPNHFGISFFFKDEPHMPSVRNAIQNSLTRAFLHRRWWINDPDCLMVRPGINLTLDEIMSLATVIGMTCGSLLLSDDLPVLPEERQRIAEVLMPPMGQRAEVIDWFDRVTPAYVKLPVKNATGNYFLVAWFNWDDQPRKAVLSPDNFKLADGSYLLRDYWQGSIGEMSNETPYEKVVVPPHGVVLMAARENNFTQPQYLGSDLHISQGNEVRSFVSGEKCVQIDFELPRQFSGVVDVLLSSQPTQVETDGKQQLGKIPGGKGVYSIELYFDRSGSIAIKSLIHEFVLTR